MARCKALTGSAVKGLTARVTLLTASRRTTRPPFSSLVYLVTFCVMTFWFANTPCLKSTMDVTNSLTLYGRSENVGETGRYFPQLNSKPAFGTSLVVIELSRYKFITDNYKINDTRINGDI